MKGRRKRKIFRKVVVLIVGLLICINVIPKGIELLKVLQNSTERKYNSESMYNSESIYVYNLTEDKEEFNLNATEKRSPASLVKIMTVYVALKSEVELSKNVPIDAAAYSRAIENNASMAGFYTYEQVTFRDLLYGTMLPSGAECANTIASYVSGSIDEYVNLMNKTAEEIGLHNTQFKNVDGLDEKGQFTTAEDVAILLREALNDGDFRAIFTKREYTSTSTLDHPQGLYMVSTVFEKLKNYNQKGFEIIGGKSGTTGKAGLCWATLAVKNGKEYLVITMGSNINDLKNPNGGQVIDTLNILREL